MLELTTRRPVPRGAALLIILLLTAFLIAGCGSKGTTVAQFKSDVNADCRAMTSNQSLENKVAAIEKTKASAAVHAEQIFPLTLPFWKKLAAISPPAGDSTAEQLHDAATAITTAINTIEADKGGTDTTALDSAGTSYQDNEQILSQDATKIGAKGCA